MTDPTNDHVREWIPEPRHQHLDPQAVWRDDLLIERLSHGERSASTESSIELAEMLSEWRDEARAAAPSRARLPRRTSRRFAMLAAALATSVSVTGVAAATAGLDPLEPLRVVIQLPDSAHSPAGSDADGHERLNRIIKRAERALLEGDLQSSRALAMQARQLAEASGAGDQGPAENRLTDLEARLSGAAVAEAGVGAGDPAEAWPDARSTAGSDGALVPEPTSASGPQPTPFSTGPSATHPLRPTHSPPAETAYDHRRGPWLADTEAGQEEEVSPDATPEAVDTATPSSTAEP